MDKEANNLFDKGSDKVFNKTYALAEASKQSEQFLGDGIKFLESQGITGSSPGFRELLDIYVRTAENSYHMSVSAFMSGVKEN